MLAQRFTDTIYVVDDSQDEEVEQKSADTCVARSIAQAPSSTPAVPLMVSDRVETGEGWAPPVGHLAHCRVCHHPRDLLLQFYEPAEGVGTIFTSCQACRHSHAPQEATAEGPPPTVRVPLRLYAKGRQQKRPRAQQKAQTVE